MPIKMKSTINSNKALILSLAFVTIGATSAYYLSESFTSDSQIQLSEVVKDSPENNSEKLNSQASDVQQPSKDTENKPNIEVLTVNTSHVELSKQQPLSIKENNIQKSTVARTNEVSKTESIEEPKTIIDKSLALLVPEEKSNLIAKDKVKKVETEIPEYDPFDLIISSQIEDSKVFEKYDYGIYINTANQLNGKLIDGEIQIYDNIRSKKISSIKTHTLAGVNDPNNRKHSVRVISAVFGYRPQELSFSLEKPDYYDSTNQTSVNLHSNSLIRVNMSLERLQVGDIAVMWKVFFFRDAAIMQPKSKPQLEDLFTMMDENSEMKIKLHGHTNGNSHGKVIHLGDHDNDDLFNVNSDKHVETVGSAQKLSLYRAETIQHYLMKKGITESRIEIKGWGGKKMIHDKHSGQANLNVRVEVEITEN
jgi:outer membrane protein OmpA-like peptidoglycan-associated protein